MKKILFTAALITLTPAILLADEPTSPGMFKHWDTNGDGVISRDEAQAAGAERIAKMFDKLDTNKDGQLTPDELRAAHEHRFAAMKERFDEQFKAADKNGDGSLSKEEAEQGMPMLAKHFDEIDTNKDGLVSVDELKAHHMKMHGGRHRPEDSQPPAQQ